MSGVNGSALNMEPEGGVAAEIDEVVWICGNCSTRVPNDRNECTECGTPITPVEDDGQELGDADAIEPEGFSATEFTPEQIAAGLDRLSGGVATAQDVENAARSEEGLEPLLPLDFGPFNPDSALKAIFDKSAEVRSLQAIYETRKEAAKDAKGELDIASKALVNIIESLKNRRTQALNPTQPFLRDVSADPLGRSACPWERDHPGQRCPICTAALAKDVVPALESEVHPEHEGHSTIAEAARVKNMLEPLAGELAKITVFVTVEELQTLSTEDLQSLVAYVSEPSPIPPQILTKTCVAAYPGSLVQVCQRCERTLRSPLDAGFVALGARVGFQCEAAPAMTIDETPSAEDVATAITEQARTIPKRGTKARAKKEPETERVKQVESGRKASGRAIPKSESARKGSGKAKAAKKGKR